MCEEILLASQVLFQLIKYDGLRLISIHAKRPLVELVLTTWNRPYTIIGEEDGRVLLERNNEVEGQ
jgi:hypothetical protein